MSPVQKMVIDTDAGVDDAHALIMALANSHVVDVVAITTVHGNTDARQVARNVLRLLKVAGRLDIPVYLGCDTSLMGHTIKATHYHGVDGLGDVPDPSAPGLEHVVQDEHAANALVRISKQYDGELCLMCLAPLTNAAVALRLDPDFGSRIKDCYIMGGNYKAVGNMTVSAEFNFYSDPESADVVLRQLGAPITMVCWELCDKYSFPWSYYQSLIAIDSEAARFIKRIEAKTLSSYYQDVNPDFKYQTADQVAMAIKLDPSIITCQKAAYVRVEVNGEMTRGQMVVDWKSKKSNVSIVLGLDMTKYGDMLLEAMKQPPK